MKLLCVSVHVELEEERKTKQRDDQSFKAILACYTARNSVAVLIPKYLILARLTGVCLHLPDRSATCSYRPAERGEASTDRTATAGADSNGAIQAGKPGGGDGVRVTLPVSAATMRCPARLIHSSKQLNPGEMSNILAQINPGGDGGGSLMAMCS